MRSRSRSWSRRSRHILVGAGAGAGAVKNGAAPAPKRETIVAKKQRNINSEIARNSWTNSLPMFVINNFRTSAMNYLNFLTARNIHLRLAENQKSFWQGHATDPGRHLGLIRLRILNALDIGSVAYDYLGAKQWSTNLRQRNPKDSVISPMSASDPGWQRVTNFKD